jgi:hypothetical protein
MHIHVCGDSTVDWAITLQTTSTLTATYLWEARETAQIIAQPGGAALLTDLLRAVAARSAPEAAQPCLEIDGPLLTTDMLSNPRNPTTHRTFASWERYVRSSHDSAPVWRMHQFLGVEPATESTPAGTSPGDGIDCLVIDDANFGFRDDPTGWPALLSENNPILRSIVLKMSNPLGTGPLWEQLIDKYADRLTLYCSVGDLRKEYAPIGQPLSWERMSQDVAAALAGRPELLRAARVVVSIGMSGAVIIERDGSATLVFDPLHQEDDWEQQHPGLPIGLGTCVTASLALIGGDSSKQPECADAIRRGLTAARQAHSHGFDVSARALHDGQSFPLAAVAEVLASTNDEEDAFERVLIVDDPEWQIFRTSISGHYQQLAARIVTEGESEVCRGLPLERMGSWSSVDRTEIESMRSVRNIIREYLRQERPARPLSLAVFGPPGSGKSFAIKQMVKQLSGSSARTAILEFNLSQFSSFDDLHQALHQVRDAVVRQALPLIFWDEFDAAVGGRDLGWLSSFLAPMQDGQFQDGASVRPIGPAIFIFAGGTHSTMASFKAHALELPAAKATDFLSRLRGYVDILGPNVSGASDWMMVLRRALLLRALLTLKAPQLVSGQRLEIDPGVLRAFLSIGHYVHGARSIEAIIDMSALSGRLRFERSALPPHHQLSLHVDPNEFLSHVGDVSQF